MDHATPGCYGGVAVTGTAPAEVTATETYNTEAAKPQEFVDTASTGE